MFAPRYTSRGDLVSGRGPLLARHSGLGGSLLRGTLTASLILSIAGCAPAPNLDPVTPTVVQTPTVVEAPPSTSQAAEPTVEPSPVESAVTVTPAPPSTVAGPPSEPPPAPTAPAPTTAGGLSETDVATAEGWHPTAKPGGPEEGFLGNGTWVHATSPEHSGYAAIALGCTELGAYPAPVAALEGNLTDDAGHPGVGLTLEFANAADAGAYFAEWVRQAEACDGAATQKVSATDDTWLGRRHLDTVWSETAGVRGNTVRLLIVNSPDADLSGALDGAR